MVASTGFAGNISVTIARKECRVGASSRLRTPKIYLMPCVALAQSEGSVMIFAESSIATGLILLAIALMGFTFHCEMRRRSARRRQFS
ncbi:hypothetical protein [Oceanibaculum indicum]|uniref:hypothetical protein n=1 Tax=Oceanibaculum indicum TaxID=526216 RepID=UPI00059369ED|nr:hypothetical protein [Oceanibaculum indicum]